MKTKEQYDALPIAEYKYPIYEEIHDKFFYNEDELSDWCAMEDIDPFTLQFYATTPFSFNIDLLDYVDDQAELENPIDEYMSQGQIDTLRHYEDCINQLIRVVLDNNNVCDVHFKSRIELPKEWKVE